MAKAKSKTAKSSSKGSAKKSPENRDVQAKGNSGQKRGAGGRFVKGQSGNPGGRPKEVGHVRDLAREHTEQAILTLVEVAQEGDDKARVAAAVALLDRGWGKPQQHVDVSGEMTVAEQAMQMTPAQRAQRLKELEERAKGGSDDD